MDSPSVIDQRYHTPEDIRVERLRGIEADPLRHIIKSQEIILKMLEDMLELLKDIKYPQWRDNVTIGPFTDSSGEVVIRPDDSSSYTVGDTLYTTNDGHVTIANDNGFPIGKVVRVNGDGTVNISFGMRDRLVQVDDSKGE